MLLIKLYEFNLSVRPLYKRGSIFGTQSFKQEVFPLAIAGKNQGTLMDRKWIVWRGEHWNKFCIVSVEELNILEEVVMKILMINTRILKNCTKTEKTIL